jgi:hypothetical protein
VAELDQVAPLVLQLHAAAVSVEVKGRGGVTAPIA